MTDKGFIQLVARLETYEEFNKEKEEGDTYDYDAIDTLHTLIMLARDKLAETYKLCHT